MQESGEIKTEENIKLLVKLKESNFKQTSRAPKQRGRAGSLNLAFCFGECFPVGESHVAQLLA